jgi:hypothetical protein
MEYHSNPLATSISVFHAAGPRGAPESMFLAKKFQALDFSKRTARRPVAEASFFLKKPARLQIPCPKKILRTTPDAVGAPGWPAKFASLSSYASQRCARQPALRRPDDLNQSTITSPTAARTKSRMCSSLSAKHLIPI